MMSKKKRAALQKQITETGRKNLKELQELMGPLFASPGRRATNSKPSKLAVIPKYRAEDTSKYPSHESTGGKDSTAKKSSPTYTGDKLKGIATMHKSNMVPIFSSEEAVEVARMRRN
jgi:hypothetical protein